jgi:ferric-dicitrate binding protein FerR (iron transport regulator)
MDEIMIRSLQGRALLREAKELRRWREDDQQNERSWRTLMALWDLVGIAEESGAADAPLDTDRIIALAEEEAQIPLVPSPPSNTGRGTEVRESSSGRGWRRQLALGAIAASFAVLAFGHGSFRLGNAGPAPLDRGDVTTGPGEGAMISLADGTAIRLGPQSQLRVTQEDGQPVVWLEGRAFFGVVPNPARTFTVRTEHGEATALGTRFEVRSEADGFRVLVVEGNVRVSAAGAAIDLGEGLMSQNRPGAPPSTSRVENVEEMLNWIGKTLVFRSTPLARAIAEVEYQYGVEVQLNDQSLRKVEVTATFTDKPLEEVIYVLSEIVGAQYVIEDAQVRLLPKAGTAQRSPI